MVISVVERYEFIVRIIRLSSKYCGCAVLNPEWQMNPLTWTVITFINMFFILTGYTVYVSIYVEGEWSHSLQALAMVGSGVHVSHWAPGI